MFSVGTYATIWAIEDKGTSSIVELSTSKKNRQTDQYETDFSNRYVRFTGSAHQVVKGLGRKDKVRIDKCGVSISKNEATGKYYTNFLVFECSVAEQRGATDSNTYDGGDDYPC